ncbi:hypothetical protein RUM43_003147 [Polyplax serrata]|uniref:Uncharacterized protein n=1 Tax=Polyplax serrata TaxID=468196 RepID=A0AAN8S310_POLSC
MTSDEEVKEIQDGSASSDPWDPTLRKTQSNPGPQTTTTSEVNHKLNSISLTDGHWIGEENSLQGNEPNQVRYRYSRTPSPTKSKLNFLENFKNVLGRSKSKPEDNEEVHVNGIRIGENGHASDKVTSKRWSEAPQSGGGQNDTNGLVSGAFAKVVVDFKAIRPDDLHVKTGDTVVIVEHNTKRGYLVKHCYEDFMSTGPEGWVPAHCLSNQADNQRKPWSFRFRKPSFANPREKRVEDAGHRISDCQRNAVFQPELLDRLKDIVVAVGERAQLTCRMRPAARPEDVSITWRFGPMDTSTVIRAGGRFSIRLSHDGFATLSICQARVADNGQYTCTVTNSAGSVSSSAYLTVTSPERVDADEDGDANWEAEQFRKRYEELQELGRGRMSVVRAARDRSTGHVVAVKQVNRKFQTPEMTRAEYGLLATLRHSHLPQALALFTNAPNPTTDSIVMELAKESLLSYICRHNDYSEKTVRRSFRQLLSALACLHLHGVFHLDIRPENILVDGNGDVKLIDLGEGVRRNSVPGSVLPPVSLEFAAPEVVLGKSANSQADMWSAGVFLYIFLSGVSPFLDETVEETTGHILQCDFFYAYEHFADVSNEAKSLVSAMIQPLPQQRLNAASCLLDPWFENEGGHVWKTEKLKKFVERRHTVTLANSTHA